MLPTFPFTPFANDWIWSTRAYSPPSPEGKSAASAQIIIADIHKMEIAWYCKNP